MLFVRSPLPPFGLDLSDLSFKLVQLQKVPQKRGKEPKIQLAASSEVVIPEGYIQGGEIKNREKVIRLTRELIKRASVKKKISQEVIVCLPETKTFIKLIKIPDLTEEEMQDAIEKEIEHFVPISLDEAYLDWQEIPAQKGKDINKKNILVGVAPRNIVDEYLNFLKDCGLIPLVLEIEAASITRSIVSEKESSQEAQIIIDLGATRSSLIVYDKETIQFSLSIPISGINLTKKIAEATGRAFGEAEEVKRACGLDKAKCSKEMKEILFSMVDGLTQKIEEAINFYEIHFPLGNKIKKVLFCGGGANFTNIEKEISQKLRLEIKKGDPWINIVKENETSPLPKDKSLSFTTAIGLALRGLQKT